MARASAGAQSSWEQALRRNRKPASPMGPEKTPSESFGAVSTIGEFKTATTFQERTTMSNHKASTKLRMAAITPPTITMHAEQPVYRVADFFKMLPQGWCGRRGGTALGGVRPQQRT